MEQTVIKNKKGISPVWILPLVAFCIVGWLLFKSIRDDGIDIKVYFDSGRGVTVGKTQVLFKGIPVGLVKGLEVDESLEKVVILIEMVKNAEHRLVEDMQFWIVKPEVSVNRITGLDTLISGSYISVLPGKSTVPARVYQGLSSQPPQKEYSQGLSIVLQADRPGSLSKGSPIYYRKMKIGQVLHLELTDDSRKVNIYAGVEKAYAPLIRDGSQFWNASGVKISGGVMTEMTVRTESIQALMSGGIAMAVPDEDHGEPVFSGHIFTMLEDPTDGWEKWSPEIWLSKHPLVEEPKEPVVTDKKEN